MIDMHEWLIPFDKIKTTDGTKTKQAICCVWFYCLNAFCFYTAKSPSREKICLWQLSRVKNNLEDECVMHRSKCNRKYQTLLTAMQKELDLIILLFRASKCIKIDILKMYRGMQLMTGLYGIMQLFSVSKYNHRAVMDGFKWQCFSQIS